MAECLSRRLKAENRHRQRMEIGRRKCWQKRHFPLTFRQNGTSVSCINTAENRRPCAAASWGLRAGNFTNRRRLDEACVPLSGDGDVRRGRISFVTGGEARGFDTASNHAVASRDGKFADCHSGFAACNGAFCPAADALRSKYGADGPACGLLTRGKGYTLFLAGGDAVLKLRTSPPVPNPRSETQVGRRASGGAGIRSPRNRRRFLRLSLAGASGKAAASGEGPLPGGTNYLSGANPSHWRTNITNYARVRYRGVYPRD